MDPSVSSGGSGGFRAPAPPIGPVSSGGSQDLAASSEAPAATLGPVSSGGFGVGAS